MKNISKHICILGVLLVIAAVFNIILDRYNSQSIVYYDDLIKKYSHLERFIMARENSIENKALMIYAEKDCIKMYSLLSTLKEKSGKEKRIYTFHLNIVLNFGEDIWDAVFYKDNGSNKIFVSIKSIKHAKTFHLIGVDKDRYIEELIKKI